MGSSHHLLLLLMFLHYAVGKPCHLLYYLPVNAYIVVVLLWYSVQCFVTQVPLIVVWRFFQTPAVAFLLRWEKTSPRHVTLLEGSAYTSDDIEWLLGNVSIAKQFYRKINETSVSVTVNISSDMSGWLRCRAAKYSLSYLPPCTYGISIRTGCKCFMLKSHVVL